MVEMGIRHQSQAIARCCRAIGRGADPAKTSAVKSLGSCTMKLDNGLSPFKKMRPTAGSLGAKR